jgi:hypothetical protein
MTRKRPATPQSPGAREIAKGREILSLIPEGRSLTLMMAIQAVVSFGVGEFVQWQ